VEDPDDPAKVHARELPKGTLYNVSQYVVVEHLEVTLHDLRRGATSQDRNLAMAAGSCKMDFGAEPWFVVFNQAVRVKDRQGQEQPLAGIGWSPPEELVLISEAGDAAFVQWPRGATPAQMTQRSESYADLVWWFMVVTVYRSAWEGGAFEFLDTDEEQYLPKWIPAGGFKLVTGVAAFAFTDGDTQRLP
jgi:hypothetical protein